MSSGTSARTRSGIVVQQRVGLLRLAGARVEADADHPRVVAVDERHRSAVAGKLAERIGPQRLDPLLDLVGQVEVDVLVDGKASEHGHLDREGLMSPRSSRAAPADRYGVLPVLGPWGFSLSRSGASCRRELIPSLR